nr:immunoglobulin heavy chain junction region [Mus musculus]
CARGGHGIKNYFDYW